MADQANLHCSFCGKAASEVKKLIAGPDTYICNECVDVCHGILNQNITVESTSSSKSIAKNQLAKLTPTPREIKEFLDQYVIGQDNAKETLAVAVYNHYKRLDNQIIDGVEIEKSNILMIGPTGVGKTLLAQTIARMLNVPFAIADATSLTEAGYVGDDVESIVTRLLQSANNDVKKCERGIIFLDEIDKKASRSSSASTSRDVSGEGVQQALLKLLEGSDILVPPTGTKKNPNTEMIKINTRNILFIVGGAFVGLDKIVEQSLAKESAGIGFGSAAKIKKEHSEIMKNLESKHLVSYGLIPELVGRLPVTTVLNELSENQLIKVLTEPKNAVIKQYIAMFKLDGIELEFDESSLNAIAKIAFKRKTGGRGLRGVIEGKLLRTQFTLPDLKKSGVVRIVINAATIEDGAQPELVYEPIATEVQNT